MSRTRTYRQRHPLPKIQCQGGDTFVDYDGSYQDATCESPATHWFRFTDEWTFVDRRTGRRNPPTVEKILLCEHHAKTHDPHFGSGEQSTPAYRFRTI